MYTIVSSFFLSFDVDLIGNWFSTSSCECVAFMCTTGLMKTFGGISVVVLDY